MMPGEESETVLTLDVGQGNERHQQMGGCKWAN